jgi:CII-binding regulator of phage lambda lysogenization HflD
LRTASLIKDSKVMANYEKKMEDLKEALENSDDADLTQFETVTETEAEIVAPLAPKKVRQVKGTKAVRTKQKVSNIDTIKARILEKQKELKKIC